jgi:hypothetical protein
MKKLFVLINHPVWRKTPYVVRVLNPTAYVEKLYNDQHYENSPFLTKREVELLGAWPAPGPRYSLLEIQVPTDTLS